MKFFNKKENHSRIFKFLFISILIALPLTGSDCEKTLISTGSVPQQMIGTWKLVEQTGALIDICPDETIDFQSNGIAILTCPNSNSISRDFTVENSILTYTQTSVAYTIQTLTIDSLYLFGENVSRNLRYLKIISDNAVKTDNEASGWNNSSEARR